MARTPTQAAEVNRAFGARVRTGRKERGWSQRALAQKTGLHWTYVGQVERGERNVSLYTILRIATGLGVEAGLLLQGLDPRRRGATDNQDTNARP